MKRRATYSGARRRCAAAWRRTTRCRRRSPWHAAPGRRRTCSPSPPQRLPRTSGTRVGGRPITTDCAVGMIGPGRAGVGLALALARAGYTVRLHGRRKKAVPKPLELTVGPADVAPPPAWLSQAGVVILAVRDDAIPPLADALARGGGVRPEHVVLHLSGVQGQEALGSLVPSRAALGSLHPLQTVAGPERAPEGPKGDGATIRRHLASLTKDDALLYRALGRAALELAEKRGMDEATAARVADALATDLPLVLRPGAGT